MLSVSLRVLMVVPTVQEHVLGDLETLNLSLGMCEDFFCLYVGTGLTPRTAVVKSK